MEHEILDLPVGEQRTFQYAGFWIRVGASIIDWIVMQVVQYGITFAFIGTGNIGLNYMQMGFGMIAVSLAVNIAYHAGMESSSKQGTLGKMAVGIKVGDASGAQISFGNALGRYLAKFISAITIFFGFIMVGFDTKKQGLHDKIANTYVFYA